jgi:D-glycero-alpha-D-manno-heptose 1-phosphate guanylyltransferase
MHVVILAGGFGTRLASVVSDVPKPLAPIAGKPFLAWLIEALAAQGIESVTLSVHHQWEKIRDYFTAHPTTIPLDYAVEKMPLGTGGAMAFALSRMPADAPVLVLNGDTFVTLDYQAMHVQHVARKAVLSMALRKVADTSRYGKVVVSDGVITAFGAGLPGEAGLINAGVYMLSPGIFSGRALSAAFSFERDFLPKYLDEIAPVAYMAEDYFIDIGIPEDYARACRELPEIAG